MLGQRRKQWINIEPALNKHLIIYWDMAESQGRVEWSCKEQVGRTVPNTALEDSGPNYIWRPILWFSLETRNVCSTFSDNTNHSPNV